MKTLIITLTAASTFLVFSSCEKSDLIESTQLIYKSCGATARSPASGQLEVEYEKSDSCKLPGPPLSCNIAFKYKNNTSATITTSLGPNNNFDFPAADTRCIPTSGVNGSCGQPTVFPPGSGVFYLTNSKQATYRWTLGTQAPEEGVCNSSLKNCSSLPITLGSFTGVWDGKRGIKLTWSTYSEQNSKEFRIYLYEPCSSIRTLVRTIATQAPNGESSSTLYYRDILIGVNPKDNIGGPYVVALEQVDIDGQTSSFPMILVRVGD